MIGKKDLLRKAVINCADKQTTVLQCHGQTFRNLRNEAYNLFTSQSYVLTTETLDLFDENSGHRIRLRWPNTVFSARSC